MIEVDLNEGTPVSKTSTLANLIHSRFTWCKTLRATQEQKWIESKMQFDGVDNGSNDDGNSKSSLYLNFTQMKCMSAYSQIMTTMMGPNGYPWSMRPTPEPELISLGLTNTREAERNPSLPTNLKNNVIKANIACDNMRIRIADDLFECNWDEKFSRAVLDLVVNGTMIIKGPFASSGTIKKWKKNDDSYEMQADQDIRADIEVVSPFEFYPDPAAFDIKDAMWAIHRHVLNKAQLLAFKNQAGFDEKEIENVIEAKQSGNWVAETWESRIYSLNRSQAQFSQSERYIAYEHWGWLTAEQLNSAGHLVDSNDKNKQFMCCVWVIDSYCIKISVSGLENPSLPFMVCPYEKILYNIWGRSLPEKMRDPQEIVNASARAMVDNMGIAAGPQVIYDTSRMVNGFKFDGLKPWGVWSVKTMEGMNQPPVQFVQTPSILGELKVLQDNFKLFIQEVTSMPDMTQGFAGTASGQHNRTASGMSMLFNAANSYIKGIVFNIDNYVTKQLIRRLYDWNMQFSNLDEIKGDFTIVAGGVQEMINIESKLSNMQELSQIMMDPEYKPYINKSAMLKEWVRTHGFDGSEIINSEEEAARIKEFMAKQESQAQIDAQPKVRAETSRPDALLQVLQNTEPDSPVYPAIYELVILSQDAMTPNMKEALEHMAETAVTKTLMDVQSRQTEFSTNDRTMAQHNIENEIEKIMMQKAQSTQSQQQPGSAPPEMPEQQVDEPMEYA